MFCAKGHLTNTCERKPEETNCANCRGKHQANDTCPVYQQKLNWIENNSRNNQYTYNSNKYQHREKEYPEMHKPAPPPKQNAWKQRPEQQQNNQQQQERQTRNIQQRQSSQQQQHPTYNRNPSKATPTDTNKFQQLAEQFEILDSLVNIDALLQAVTDLNTQLKTCRTPEQIFTTYTTFMKHLHKYDI